MALDLSDAVASSSQHLSNALSSAEPGKRGAPSKVMSSITGTRVNDCNKESFIGWPPSWKISNGHISGMGYRSTFMNKRAALEEYGRK